MLDEKTVRPRTFQCLGAGLCIGENAGRRVRSIRVSGRGVLYTLTQAQAASEGVGHEFLRW